MNSRDDATAIDLNQLVEALNTRITKQKACQRRGGTDEYGNVGVSDTIGTVLAEYQYFDDDDDAHDLRALYLSSGDQTKIQKLVDGTWEDLTGATFDGDNKPYFVTFRGLKGPASLTGTTSIGTEYTMVPTTTLSDGTHAGRVIKITAGTGVGQHRLILSNSTTTFELYERWDTIPDNTSTFEVYNVVDCCYITQGVNRPVMYEGTGDSVIRLEGVKRYRGWVVHKNKLLSWGGPDIDDDEVNWSCEGFGGDTPKYAHQEFYTTRGESIVGIAPEVGNRAIVYKQRSTHALLGDTIESFTIADIDGAIGCIAPFTIKSYNNIAYFLSHRGVEVCDGIKVGYGSPGTPISDVIRTNQQAWSPSLLINAYAEIFNQRYYISVAKDNTSTYNDQVWVFDITFGLQGKEASGWVYDEGYYAGCLVVRKSDGNKDGQDELYFGDARANGKSWQLETGADDGGNDITMRIITGKLAMSTIARNKNFEKGYYVVPSTQEEESLVIDRQVDDNGWVTVDTFALSNNPLMLPFTLPGILGQTGLNTFSRFIIDQGHFLQHRFINQGALEAVTILGYTVIATDLSLP